jgi:hypothetical protein
LQNPLNDCITGSILGSPVFAKSMHVLTALSKTEGIQEDVLW